MINTMERNPSCVEADQMTLKSQMSVTQSALRACVFVLKQLLAFGWRICQTFRKLYRAALAFQRADMSSSNL